MYNHSLKDNNGPGSLWSPSEKKLLVGSCLATIDNVFSDDHYHLYVKYGYAKAYLCQSPDLLFWASFYDRMQIARVGYSRRADFDKLVSSMSTSGFDARYPIPVNREYAILDGSHRAVAALATGAMPRVEVYDSPAHTYDRHWFESVGFSSIELSMADGVRADIVAKIAKAAIGFTGIIWGEAISHWDAILAILDDGHLSTAFCIDLLDQLDMMGFVIRSYYGDGMPLDRMVDKGQRLARASTKAGIFVLCDVSTQEAAQVKRLIRERFRPMMDNYFYDNIIHIIDCPEASRFILSSYGSPLRKKI